MKETTRSRLVYGRAANRVRSLLRTFSTSSVRSLLIAHRLLPLRCRMRRTQDRALTGGRVTMCSAPRGSEVGTGVSPRPDSGRDIRYSVFLRPRLCVCGAMCYGEPSSRREPGFCTQNVPKLSAQALDGAHKTSRPTASLIERDDHFYVQFHDNPRTPSRRCAWLKTKVRHKVRVDEVVA